MIQVTVWVESDAAHLDESVLRVYPKGMAQAIADFLNTCDDISARTATLDDPHCGLDDEALNNTDVLLWWGHGRHDEVPDELVQKIYDRVMRGMGFIPLHSAHFSKPFVRLMGTTCSLQWREDDRERLWCVLPSHPIAEGFGGQGRLFRDRNVACPARRYQNRAVAVWRGQIADDSYSCGFIVVQSRKLRLQCHGAFR